MSAAPEVRIALVDMNNGVANQATRCFRRLVDGFQRRVRVQNPTVEFTFHHLQPRNLGEVPDGSYDLVLSSGGPGAPLDGFDDTWGKGYRRFLDGVAEANAKDPVRSTKALLICHSFELAVLHFGVAEMRLRPTTKFGVMPAYLTDDGQLLDYLGPFGYRLFTFEHRNWEAVNLDAAKLARLGGKVLAHEAHAASVVNQGDAILGLRFAGGLDGLQFHPEADKPGVMAWVEKPEHQERLRDAYGDDLFGKMVRTLADPTRLARTFALLIPSWLTYRFNDFAQDRGLEPLAAPEFDMQEFDVAV